MASGPGISGTGTEKPSGWSGYGGGKEQRFPFEFSSDQTVPASGITGFTETPSMVAAAAGSTITDQGIGVRFRISAIRGETAKGVLSKPLYLPAVLNDIVVDEAADFTDVKTHRAGEFSFPAQGGKAARNLRELPIDFLTLDWKAPWLRWRDPDVVQDELIAILRSRKPVAVLLTLPHPKGRPTMFTSNVTLRQAPRTLKPGEADTRYWSLTWKEWRPLEGTRLTSAPAKHGRRLPTTHSLAAGDTLESLSKFYYGTKALWRVIARANHLSHWGARAKLVKHPRLKVGSAVKIPKKPDGPIVTGGHVQS